jgi:putative toxin-antitoxin system antitoxin component (TIGR02293 family)
MTAQAIEQLSYKEVDDRNVIHLIGAVRDGIAYDVFETIAGHSPFSIDEWSQFLHLSGRTMQRYKKEQKTFEPIQSERILRITLLNNKGEEVFGDMARFHTWLNHKNIALGGILPKDLLDTDFGIDLLKDELIRIETGVLA